MLTPACGRRACDFSNPASAQQGRGRFGVRPRDGCLQRGLQLATCWHPSGRPKLAWHSLPQYRAIWQRLHRMSCPTPASSAVWSQYLHTTTVRGAAARAARAARASSLPAASSTDCRSCWSVKPVSLRHSAGPGERRGGAGMAAVRAAAGEAGISRGSGQPGGVATAQVGSQPGRGGPGWRAHRYRCTGAAALPALTRGGTPTANHRHHAPPTHTHSGCSLQGRRPGPEWRPHGRAFGPRARV